MKNDIIKSFNLPPYIKGKSFAEASKAIQKKFEDREDPASERTMNELLERLKNAQEFVKQQNEPQQEVPQQSMESSEMMTQIPNEQPQQEMAEGGFMSGFGDSQFGAGLQEGATGAEKAGTVAAGIGGAMALADMGKTAFGNAENNIDMSGETAYTAPTKGGAALGVAAKGEQAGMAFGPWGAAIGGVLGGVSGLISGGKQQKAVLKAQHNKTSKDFNNALNPYAEGGELTNPTNPIKKQARQTGDMDFITLPSNENPILENNARISYAKRNNLSVEQLGGFEDQKESDAQWRDRRDKYFSDEFQKWRSGKTGATYHDKYSQSSSEYQNAWKNIKDTWYKENPRQINNTVMDYRLAGGQGEGQGQTFGKYENTMLASNSFDNGGYIKKDASVNGANEYDYNKDPLNIVGKFDANDFSNKTNIFQDGTFKQPVTGPTSRATTKMDLAAQDTGDWLKNNYSNVLRFAPAVMNAFQLSKMSKPEVENLDKLDNRYKKQFVDEKSLQNSVNENFNTNSLVEGSGGSLSRYSSAARAQNLNKAKAMSDAYIKASDINRNEERTAQQFNRQTDQFNISQSNREKDINAKNRASYLNNKSKLLSQIGNDIGNIGKEGVLKNQAKEIFGYTWDGKYYVNNQGDKLTKQQMLEKAKTNSNMFGGYLKKK